MPDLGVKQSRTWAFTELTELNHVLHKSVLLAKRAFRALLSVALKTRRRATL